MVVSLRVLAYGKSFKDVEELFGMSRSFAWVSFNLFTEEII